MFIGHTEAVGINDRWKGDVPRTTSQKLSSSSDVKRIDLDATSFEPDVKRIVLDVKNIEPDVKRIELDVDCRARWPVEGGARSEALEREVRGTTRFC